MSKILKRPSQSSFANDQVYINIVASGSEKEVAAATEQLFLKYLPLIQTVATKFNLGPEDREDFISEAYFSILKTLKYVDPTKIDENFSFGYFLRFNLYNQGISNINASKRRVRSVSYDALLESKAPVLCEASLDEEKALEAVFGDKETALHALETVPTSFIKARDKQILRSLLLGKTSREVGDEVHLSEQRVKKISNTSAETLHAIAFA